MNFVLINRRNNNFGLTKTFNTNTQPTNKNYVIHNKSRKETNLNTSQTKGLRNMFSLIKYAKTSCGSCSGAR
tara:strand:- start:987 stop:1202 length:216 start_codon:yes stop_codon:yes gene_type:complete